MNLWESVRKDLEKGIKGGVDSFWEGALRMRKRAEELTGEGKRRYALFQLKGHVHQAMTELGGRIYELHAREGDALADRKIQALLKRIRRLEMQIGRLEGAGLPAKKKGLQKKNIAGGKRSSRRKEKA